MPRQSLVYAGLLFLTVASASSGRAQDENTPPPTPPCVGALPDKFSFVKQITYKTDPSESSAEKAAQNALTPPATQIKELDAIQSGGVRRDTQTFMDGSVREVWRQKNCRFTVYPTRPDSILVTFVTDSVAPGIPGQNLDAPDFAELDWITINMYQGIQEQQGKKCYFYKLDDQTAWIEVATKLPVCFESNAMRVTYTFKDPPDQPLQLPAKFAQKLDQVKHAWMGQ